jgi:hypothetical protein
MAYPRGPCSSSCSASVRRRCGRACWRIATATRLKAGLPSTCSPIFSRHAVDRVPREYRPRAACAPRWRGTANWSKALSLMRIQGPLRLPSNVWASLIQETFKANLSEIVDATCGPWLMDASSLAPDLLGTLSAHRKVARQRSCRPAPADALGADPGQTRVREFTGVSCGSDGQLNRAAHRVHIGNFFKQDL